MLCTILLSFLPLAMQAPPAGQAAAEKSEPSAAQQAPAFAEQSICPVDGKALANRNSFIDYEGMRIYHCGSDKCKKHLSSFPDKWLFALQRKKQAPENIQTTCAVSGSALKPEAVTIWMGNKSFKVNSEACAKLFQKHPSYYADKLDGRGPQQECAVMGGDLKLKNAFAVQGTRVDQCCAPCEKKWRKDPDKYFAKLTQAKVVLQPVHAKCAVAPDKAAKAMHFATYGSRRLYFSDDKARTRFLLNPQAYLKKLPDLAIGAVPSKVPFPAPKKGSGKCPTP